MSKPKIVFALYDGLADVYAMKTLHDYLVEKDFPAEMEFVVTDITFNNAHKKLPIAEKILGTTLKICKRNELDEEFNPDIVVGGFSDINSAADFRRSVKIDLSILKNCVKPVSKREREQLRKKYEVLNEKPILVISNPSTYERSFCMPEEKLNEILNLADVYLVGMFLGIYSDSPGFRKVRQYGVLKDYYAMADASLMADTLEGKLCNIHNFVEATEGGPLFLVKPDNTAQYGYKQLVERKVIREADNAEKLVDKVKEYLQNPEGAYLRALRARHLHRSRKKYLEDIAVFLARALKLTDKKPSSDLMTNIKLHADWLNVKIFHPETCWEEYSEDEIGPITKVSEEVYEKFWRWK